MSKTFTSKRTGTAFHITRVTLGSFEVEVDPQVDRSTFHTLPTLKAAVAFINSHPHH